MMGDATASCGAVVVHYQTPLAAALTALRAAEQRAKNEGGRNAFSLSVMKRSGGVLHLTAKWDVVRLLSRLGDFLGEPAVSRRAVYNSVKWLTDLPNSADEAMLGVLFAHQFRQQTSSGPISDRVSPLANELACAAVARGQADWKPWVSNLLTVAEFLAREGRRPDPPGATGDSES